VPNTKKVDAAISAMSHVTPEEEEAVRLSLLAIVPLTGEEARV